MKLRIIDKAVITGVGAAAGGVCLRAVTGPRKRVTINCNLTPEEYDRICREFHLKPDVMMEYIYRRGGDRYGVRLAADKLRIDDICGMFTIPIIREKLPEILKRRGSYPSSDNTIVKACNFTPAAKQGSDYMVHIFKVDDCEYMEIEKPETDNLSIFLHS